jgi:hypothetical protein
MATVSITSNEGRLPPASAVLEVMLESCTSRMARSSIAVRTAR